MSHANKRELLHDTTHEGCGVLFLSRTFARHRSGGTCHDIKGGSCAHKLRVFTHAQLLLYYKCTLPRYLRGNQPARRPPRYDRPPESPILLVYTAVYIAIVFDRDRPRRTRRAGRARRHSLRARGVHSRRPALPSQHRAGRELCAACAPSDCAAVCVSSRVRLGCSWRRSGRMPADPVLTPLERRVMMQHRWAWVMWEAVSLSTTAGQQ